MSRTAATVLRSVLDHGPVARSTIARLTGLSAATVTKQYAELAERGLVREVDTRVPRVTIGRPHVPVDIDVDRHVVCGVHIAYGHTTLALVDLRGRVLAQEREPHDRPAPDWALRRIAERVPAFLRRHDRVPIGVGVATGGRVDDGAIVEHSQLGWKDVRAKEFLTTALDTAVQVESHSRALARAEQLFGADPRARTSLVHLFVGNVVDAAIVTGGGVHSGPGGAAGEIAHLRLRHDDTPCPCGRRGCLQAATSNRTLAERAARAGITAEPSLDLLIEVGRQGDPRAIELFRRRSRLVGQAARLLLDVINPDVLVVVEAGAILIPGCWEELTSEIGERSGDVIQTSFGSDVLSVAAGSVVLSEIYGGPTYFP
ncbi:Sugar kinase of the NBD/HSP70 family, may contain an N-terminal HTH domain [Lentzea waywayandensis]|uniref:Sugar kinase of the NBD/HSP70 family, may contain an N-terminal HTH domain n=1 Tax=Lentzea waywayandensis TaxID=84724 RepID=A0A1I6FEZ6_9PSEU|nr:ROK family transcriptional regulator [Lentzea waywayandensis]SFR28452.1 Sugar kinase of the NBD/HSP70 family, may contain an N-terminal HTH domain [Lentzea waywayandensis]